MAKKNKKKEDETNHGDGSCDHFEINDYLCKRIAL